MSYVVLLLLFLVVPTLLLGTAVARRVAHEPALRPALRRTLPVVVLLVPVSAGWSAPWDQWMIDRGIFVYPPEKVVGWIARIPVEDLLLFACQGLFVGLWALLFVGRLPSSDIRPDRARAAMLSTVGLIVAVTVAIASSGSPHATYTMSILVWFGPLILVQLVAGTGALLARWRLWLVTIVPATLWLWLLELVAIRQDIWWIDPARSVGWRPFGLPAEDLLIFLVGNVLVVHTVLFLDDPAMRARAAGWLPRRVSQEIRARGDRRDRSDRRGRGDQRDRRDRSERQERSGRSDPRDQREREETR
ncbi:hypothetical protein GCM10023083_56440 [Streptomyces phyllanthi]|uniref:lycopene cyclase domain-containing protein n=1 Tax=Streptomyces phyllanthi TaxID=1803180 RepID=UPI0031E7A19C